MANFITPRDLEGFDALLSAIVRDRLAGRLSPAEAVKLEDEARTQREEFIMRQGG